MAIASDVSFILLGEPVSSGCYLLFVQLGTGQKVSFGRFNGADAVFLPAAAYMYVGSARGEKGSSSLGYRLMRHATRTDPDRPHAIREELHLHLQNAGIEVKVPTRKRLHWHIDYLLDLPQAEISGGIIIRTIKDLEAKIAEELAALPEVSIPARGLGASDHQGGTHLFRLQGDTGWQEKITELIQGLARSR